jgi:multidrug efflux pump subunit AcrA (membrane-fusion protein)
MRLSSFFFLGLILVAFGAIQGWVLVQRFVAPEVFTTQEAVLEGILVEVRTPTQGTVRQVWVQEDERVEQGKELFTLFRTVRDPATQEDREEEFTVTAVRAGVVTDIQAVEGTFAQSDQKLAHLVDNAPDVLHVRARLSVLPADVPKIQPLMRGTVEAGFVNGGNPMDAVISSIDPVYDADTETLEVRMRFVDPGEELQRLAVGLPVKASVVIERPVPTNPVLVFFSRLFPSSQANVQ